jgi:hypothetical protein
MAVKRPKCAEMRVYWAVTVRDEFPVTSQDASLDPSPVNAAERSLASLTMVRSVNEPRHRFSAAAREF